LRKLLQSQRELRQKRVAAIKRGKVALLDIGTSKIVCLVLTFVEDSKSHLLNSDQRTNSHISFRVVGASTTKSRGVRFGEIHEMEEAERAVRTVVQRAQKMAGGLIENVFLTFSGGNPKSKILKSFIDLQKKEVTESDIGHVLSKINLDHLQENKEIIHALPVNFSVDDRHGYMDPRGITGSKLAVDVHALEIQNASIQNMVNCLNKCDLSLSGIAYAPYLSGLSSLLEDEMQLGAVCFDLGAGCSSISIFFRKNLIFSGSIKIGGLHISNDIMQAFQVSFAAAERIKVLFGGLISTSSDERETIEIPGNQNDLYSDRLTITRSELIGVIRPRVEEIFDELKNLLQKSDFDFLPGQKIILTGGGSKMPGLLEFSSGFLGKPVRVARPMRIQGLPQATHGPETAAIIGLALHIAQPHDEIWDFKVPFEHDGDEIFRRTWRWLKTNW
jgi:cell division protein FtsA